MSILNRLEILKEGALKTESVKLDSGEIIVSQIGGADYIALWTDPQNQKETGEIVVKNGVEEKVLTVDMSRFTPALIAYAVVDENGNRVFTDEDIPVIARLASGPFLKISEIARKLNGLAGDEVKNSDDNLNESSSSDLV
jgi:hypothetical protein